MIHLEKINGENIWDILKLNVSDSQKNFVASNDISIIEAYTAITSNGYAFPFGIFEGNNPVGFVMIGYDKDDYWKDAPAIADGNYNLWRLMIDKNYQNRGYGKQAVELALRFIRTFPCGKADFCWLSYEPEKRSCQIFVCLFWIYRDRRKGRRRANCRIKTLRQLPVCRTEKLLKTKYQPPPAASRSSKSEKDLLLFLLSIWQNRKVTRSR